jgi:VanZ family protein
VIIYYGVFFTGQLPDHRWITGWNDILLHTAAFAVLTVFILPLSHSTAVPVLALAIFAALIEVAQIPMPERSASLSDVAANFVGIALGLGFVGTVRWVRKWWFDPKPHADQQFETV